MNNNCPFPDKYLDDIKGNILENYFTPILKEVCNEIDFRSVLDVGCGNGIFSAALKNLKECELYGIDGSPYALSECKKLGFTEVQFVKDFSNDLIPYPDHFFDFAICKDVFEHLLTPSFLLQEIFRVLKPNGYLLAHIPNHFPIYGRLRFLFFNDIDTFHYYHGCKRWELPHIRFFTYEDFKNFLLQKEFIIIKDFNCYFFPFPLVRFIPFELRSYISRFLIGISPSQFAGGFTLLAQKSINIDESLKKE